MPNNQQITLDQQLNWQLTTTTKPTPAADELLIEVKAASLNPIDLKRRPTTQTILGYDGYGTIVAIGAEVDQFSVGQTVFYAGTTHKDGSFQNYQTVAAQLCALAPTNLTPAQAAGLPLVSLTAFELLFEKLHFTAAPQANQGQTLLIINGAGGVGSILSQLAQWAGLTVYATSSPSHFDWLKKNGVTQPVDYHAVSQHQTLAQIPDIHFDAIAVLYDITSYLPELSRLIKPLGQIGAIVGVDHPLDLAALKAKSVSFAWEYMFTKTDFKVNQASQGAILHQIAHLMTQQSLQPITTQTFNGLTAHTFTAASEALTSGHATGKNVIVY